VNTRGAPEHPVALTFIDVRHRFGVWLAAFTAQRDGAGSIVLPGPLLVPLRPRTATVRKSAHAIITGIDDRTTRMLGWTAEQMVGARSTEFIHPDDHERAVANWLEMLSKQESQRVRLRHRCLDGSWLWVEIENTYQGADNPEDIVVIAQMSDISDEMAAHEAVNQREKLFRRLADSLPMFLIVCQGLHEPRRGARHRGARRRPCTGRCHCPPGPSTCARASVWPAPSPGSPATR
jgi:PAS domain S-box-containing protein